MEKIQQIGFLMLALTVTSCFGGKSAEQVKPPGTPSVVSAGTAANSPSRLCSLFSTAEIKELLGTPYRQGGLGEFRHKPLLTRGLLTLNAF